MKSIRFNRRSLLILAILACPLQRSAAEYAEQTTQAVAAPAPGAPAARETATRSTVKKLRALTPLVAGGKQDLSPWLEGMRIKKDALSRTVRVQRQAELDEGVREEEKSVLTPADDTLTLKLGSGQVIRLHNLGTADATTIGVNKIWPGGANASTLHGGGITGPPAGTTITQFEQYIPYLPHQEFDSPSRVADIESIGAFDSHATSVAGVMMAGGFSPAAKGMAYQGKISAYSWFDPFGTILSQGMADSRVSNHSYGGVFGWDSSPITVPVQNQPSITRTVNYFVGDIFASTTKSPYFGLYDSQARMADATAFAQPYQLIVAAAGNDRGQNKFDGYQAIYVGGNPYFIAQAGLVTTGIQEDVLFNGTDYWYFAQGDLSAVNPNTASEQIIFTPHAGQVASPLSGTPLADGGALGFDTIPEGLQTSKNALTVGSVISSAGALWTQVQSASVVGQGTVFGPTDDGRIKPDVMANGVNVTAPSLEIVGGVFQTDKYTTTATGSSFSAAGVSGGASMLSELQERTVNFSPEEPLRAATLKGVIIHTASEASTPGPDYRSGWGVAQIDKAAALIQTNYNSGARTSIKEVVLRNGDEVAFTVSASGGQPIKVTASWADPVAQPDPLTGLYPDQQSWTESSPGSGVYVEPSNSVLNNNIDVRVYPITNNSTTPPTLGPAIMPWKLNPASPASAATRGQNDLDNVEQVVSQNSPAAGTLYRVVVAQKAGTTLIDADGDGLINDPQPLSIIVTGVSVQTENFAITGSSYSFSGGNVKATLTWNSLVGGYYIIESSTDLSTWNPASGVFNTIAESTQADSDPVPATPTHFFRVKKVSPNPFHL